MCLHCTYGTLMCEINIYYLSHNLCIAKDKIMATLCECNTSVRHIGARQKYLIFRDYVSSNRFSFLVTHVRNVVLLFYFFEEREGCIWSISINFVHTQFFIPPPTFPYEQH
jgi:hypothetical protein